MGTSAGPGSLVAGRYRLEAPLGEGGFGAVFRATEVSGGRVVALKILLRDVVDMGPRFRREAELAMRLSHPNTVRTLDAGEDGALGPYIVLELLEGQSLDATLRARGAMDPRRAGAVVCAVLASLEEAHGLGIIHRDIKPANVFLVEGPTPTVKVLDFGIAKSTNANTHAGLTRAGQTVGTPAYMAPEQVAGTPLGPETDLYAVGLLLAEVLAGRPVYGGREPMTVLIEKLNGEPAPLPESLRGTALEPVVRRAVAQHREARWRTAAEMRRAIEAAVASMPDVIVEPPAAASRGAREPALDATVGAALGGAPWAPAAWAPTASAAYTPHHAPTGHGPPHRAPLHQQPHPPYGPSYGPPLAALGAPLQQVGSASGGASGLGMGCLVGGAIFLGLVLVAAAAGFVLFGLDASTGPAPPTPATVAGEAPGPGDDRPPPVPHTIQAVACPRLASLDPRSLNASIRRAGFEVENQSEERGAETSIVFELTRSGLEAGLLVFYEGPTPLDSMVTLSGVAEAPVTHAIVGRRLLFMTMEGSAAPLLGTICGGGPARGGGTP